MQAITMINIHAAKTNLSSLLAVMAQTQKPFIIAKAGTPLAVVSPYQHERLTKRVLGGLQGRVRLPSAKKNRTYQKEIEAMFYVEGQQ